MNHRCQVENGNAPSILFLLLVNLNKSVLHFKATKGCLMLSEPETNDTIVWNPVTVFSELKRDFS